jgi:hypothetical protein
LVRYYTLSYLKLGRAPEDAFRLLVISKEGKKARKEGINRE